MGLPLLGAGTLAGEVARGLARRLRNQLGERGTLNLYISIYKALSVGGGQVLREAGSPELLEQTLAAVAREDTLDIRAVATLVNERFPLLIAAPDGWLWRRGGMHYQRLPVGPTPLAAVDDVTGALYASDGGSEGAPLIQFDEDSSQWRSTGLREARSVVASGGRLFALLADGRLVSYRSGEGASQLSSQLFQGSLQAGEGVLYLVAERGGLHDVYRLRDRVWDRHGDPLVTGLRKVVASGTTWYGVDAAGHLRWGQGGGLVSDQVIDEDGDVAALWLLGRDLLVLTEAAKLFLFSAERDAWISLEP